MQSTDKLRILRLCPVFRSADMEALGLLSEILSAEQFRASETIFLGGEPATSIIIVAEGQVAVHLSGEETPINTMGPGEIAGEFGLFAHGVRTATLMAAEDTTVLSMEYERFELFLRECPDALFELMRIAVSRIVRLSEIVSQEHNHESSDRTRLTGPRVGRFR